jgi:FkbM family methyltransferase
LKGQWIIALTKRVLDNSLHPRDALSYLLWRIHHSDTLILDKIKFTQVDHTLWSLAGETFIRREYCPKGFEISPDTIVVDIGAHRGVFVGFASRRRPRQILAIEPDNENFQHLQFFVTQNKLSNITLLNRAVSSQDGEVKLYKSTHSRHSIQRQSYGENLFEIVQSMSLNSLLAPYQKIDFLKMDCEGEEYKIFQAASLDSLEKIQTLSMEIHDINKSTFVAELRSKLSKSFSHVKIKQLSPTLGMLYAQKR